MQLKCKRLYRLTGYEIAMEKGWNDVAQIALTHSFINDKIEAFHFPNNEFKDADIKKTEEIFSKLKLNEYDYMVRMGDFISIGDTQKPVTVEERLHDIRTRYPMSDTEFEKLNNTITKLKNYWDKRLGCNLYEIL